MANIPKKKSVVIPKGEFPEGEVIVAMLEYRGMIHIATNKHIYQLAGRDRNRLQKMEFTFG